MPDDTPKAFVVKAGDNVATLLDPTPGGTVRLLGEAPAEVVEALERTDAGHKLALAALAEGEPIVKSGVTIGFAKVAINTGQWVHLHNCRSGYDERSADLDVHTGAAEDTPYD